MQVEGRVSKSSAGPRGAAVSTCRTSYRKSRTGWVDILGTATFPTNKIPTFEEPGKLDLRSPLSNLVWCQDISRGNASP